MAQRLASHLELVRPDGGHDGPTVRRLHPRLDIVLDRNAAFWDAVATHPQVAPHVFLGQDSMSLREVVEHPSVTPLRSENGGFIFAKLDGAARVYELHTLYLPEGWGREVNAAAKLAFAWMFREGAQVIVTYEISGWKKSQPPLSFGFKAAGDFAPAYGKSLKAWVLTRDAWDNSPVGGKA